MYWWRELFVEIFVEGRNHHQGHKLPGQRLLENLSYFLVFIGAIGILAMFALSVLMPSGVAYGVFLATYVVLVFSGLFGVRHTRNPDKAWNFIIFGAALFVILLFAHDVSDKFPVISGIPYNLYMWMVSISPRAQRVLANSSDYHSRFQAVLAYIDYIFPLLYIIGGFKLKNAGADDDV